MHLSGVILAAGESRRMGHSKALLPCGSGGETFVARIARTLIVGGVQDVIVVGRPDDAELREHVRALASVAHYETNAEPSRGQLSSLLVGVDAAVARGADAVLMMPVDMPQVRADSVAAVITAWRGSAAPVVRAAHAGRHGHPVIFRREIFPELHAADPRLGAKAVLHRHAQEILDVQVDDPGVLRDFDLPEEYEAAFGPLSGRT